MEEKPAEVIPPVVVPPKKFPVWNLIIGLLILFILGVSVFIAYTLGSKQNTPVPTSTPAVVPTTPTTQSTQKRIVYVNNGVLYIINADGTDKKTLVDNRPTNLSFANGAWKDKNNFSYSNCQNSTCTINTININNNVETKETERPGIATLAWNHAGSQLAYMYKNAGDQHVLSFQSTPEKIVKTFAQSFGRGGSLDDNISMYFSSDDKYLLVTNTGTQPNDSDKNTIWVFEVNGKEILNLEADSSWPTQARWIDNMTFLYKKGDKFYLRQITSDASQVLPDPIGYNPVYLGGKVYSWTAGDPPKIGNIAGYYRPEVLDSTHLVAIKSKKPEGEFMFPFEPAGLSVIDLGTAKATDLDLGSIGLFSLSP